MDGDSDYVTPAWLQMALSALRDALDVHPELRAEMVQFLFDVGLWDKAKLSWPAALNRFQANLNPGRSEAWKLVEIWALCKRFERFALFHAMADDFGYEVRRRATEERRQELLERLGAQLARSNDLAEQALAALGTLVPPANGKRMHPALRDGSATFATSARELVEVPPGDKPAAMSF